MLGKITKIYPKNNSMIFEETEDKKNLLFSHKHSEFSSNDSILGHLYIWVKGSICCLWKLSGPIHPH